MGIMNRLANCHNRFQGPERRVLCVCSAGLLRSPTAAWVLSNPPFLFNTRAAGIDPEFALIPVDQVLLEWADTIVCMTEDQRIDLEQMMEEDQKPILCLGIEDSFERMNPELIERIIAGCQSLLK